MIRTGDLPSWISVLDRHPIEQDFKSTYLVREVLVTDGKIVCEGCYSIGGNHVGKPWQSFNDCMIRADNITHWMPLPEPPVSKM